MFLYSDSPDEMSSCVFYLRWLEMYAVLSDFFPEEAQSSCEILEL